jgi:hypothetical protein
MAFIVVCKDERSADRPAQFIGTHIDHGGEIE